MTMTTRLLLILMLLTPLPVAADARDASAPYVARSHVILPRQVEQYVLENTAYDPGNRAAGVGARYTIPGHPEARLDIFVYPAGEMPPAAALDQGMKDFRETFRYGVDNGYYTDFKIIKDAVHDLPPDAAEEPSIGKDEADPVLAEAFRLLEPQPLPGRLLVLSFTHLPSQMPMHSRGYLFYKQFYFFKGRISAARSRISDNAFASLADEAIGLLVPRIQVLNVGECATVNIPIDDGAPDDEERAVAGAASLVRGLARVQRNNCSGNDDALASSSKDADVVTIEFSPGEWSSP